MLPIHQNPNGKNIYLHSSSKPLAFSLPQAKTALLSYHQTGSHSSNCFLDLCNKISDFFQWIFRWLFGSIQAANEPISSKAPLTNLPQLKQISPTTELETEPLVQQVGVEAAAHEQVKESQYIYLDIEKEAPRFFFKEDEQEIVAKALSLIDRDVYDYLVEGLADEAVFTRFTAQGFSFLNSHLTHPELPNWIMKGGREYTSGKGVSNSAGTGAPNKYDHLMRVFMAERMSQIIQEEDLGIIIAEKRLLQSPFSSSSPHKKYLVFSQKLDVLSESRTIEVLSKMPEHEQRTLARKICTLIQKAGVMDAHFGNFCWSPSLKKICMVDTESLGLLIAKDDLSPKTKKTIEECARIGLHKLRDWSFAANLSIFEEEARHAIDKMAKV